MGWGNIMGQFGGLGPVDRFEDVLEGKGAGGVLNGALDARPGLGLSSMHLLNNTRCGGTADAGSGRAAQGIYIYTRIRWAAR